MTAKALKASSAVFKVQQKWGEKSVKISSNLSTFLENIPYKIVIKLKKKFFFFEYSAPRLIRAN